MSADQHIRDTMELQELIARYNYTVDHEQYDEWASTFAPEGVFQGAIGRFLVHKELDQFIVAMKSLAAQAPNPRHFVTNILPKFDGDRGTCTSFLLMTSTTKEGTRPVIAGEYVDKLVRHNGKWLFLERIVRVDGGWSP
jgi:hypothetical protein